MINKPSVQKVIKTAVKKEGMTQWQKRIASSLLLAFCMPLLSYAASGSVSAELPATTHATTHATIIQFSEYEQGTGTHPVTMTITDNYLRIDDSLSRNMEKIKDGTSDGSLHADDSLQAEGSLPAEGSLHAEGSLQAEGSQQADGSEEDSGFVLFDRKAKVIYSVSSEEQQIIKVSHVPVTMPSPIALKLRSTKIAMDENTPLISGKKTQNHQIFVNDKLCYNLITVPGLMPDAVLAMSNFNQVLAGQQAETLRYIPADLHEACDLARHTFYPQKHLENGFPLMFQAVDETGKIENVKYSRTLINFKQQDVPVEFFVLPEYSIVPIN